MSLLQHMIEENEPYTENARYILALMLERKRILTPTAVKETEQGRMLFYENRKTGDAFVIRDPQLRLDEVAGVQEEVATLLGFGGPDSPPPKSSKTKAKGSAEPAPEEVAPTVEEPSTNTAETPAEPESPPASEPESAQEVEEEGHASL